MRPKRPTIYEVADRAGVSHQTVSRYLRKNGGLKPGTVDRVRAAIDELQYRPNQLARSMRTRRTGRIAILLPTATKLLPLRLLGALSGAAHEAGYAVDLVGLEGAAEDRAARALELGDSGEFEGILALASLGAASVTWSAPVVVFSDYDDELHGQGALADGAACGEVVRYLRGLGHRDFLHLAGPETFASARNRRQTFVDTVAGLGLHGIVIDCGWSGPVGVRRGSGTAGGHRGHGRGGGERPVGHGRRAGQPDAWLDGPRRPQCLRLGRRGARTVRLAIVVHRRHRSRTPGSGSDAPTDRRHAWRRAATGGSTVVAHSRSARINRAGAEPGLAATPRVLTGRRVTRRSHRH